MRQNSINVFVEHAGYEVFSVFFWKDETMGAGAQIVFVGASGREECMKDVAGVRPNSSEQAIVSSITHDLRHGSSERKVAEALCLADEPLKPVPLPLARIPPPGRRRVHETRHCKGARGFV